MNCKFMPLRVAKLITALFILFFLNQRAVSQNAIVLENQLAGTAQSLWDANDNGDVEGFTEEFSVNKGETVHFKIDVNSVLPQSYTVKIYRLGYYNGAGARFIADLGNSLSGSLQPTPNYDPVTGKLDCNNWARSASWAVPANAVSGIYIARLDCPYFSGPTNKTIMLFVVRDDAANSPVLFKTSDATWQAYNTYGGNTFYGAATPVPGFAHATKISYQRPLHNRGDKSGFFNSEYPMLRWLEKNGYNVSYTTDMDMARDATPFTPSIHKTILSVGHDEYWSTEQYDKIETARNNGVHLAFFSGNEVYWKTRWEDNYQTLVCYKEGTKGELVCGNKCDPMPGVWTGLWRDGCTPTYAANDGCRPEGPLTGQMSWTQSTGSIKVPDTYKNLTFWKNTSVASLGSGQTKTLPYGTLGNEWDPEQLTETYPSHRIILSNTTQAGFTHKMSIYRHSSGAFVFASGTMQWPWGLDVNHDLNTATPPVQPVSPDMKQATVNLLYSYMGVAPGSIEGGLVLPSSFADNTAPTTVITFPVHNTNVPGSSITITGTSTDNGGGSIAGVEVSLDNGTTWVSANGLENWTYTFSPAGYGTQDIRVRAWDDFGNLETIGALGSANHISVAFTGPFNYSVFNSSYPTNPPLFFTGGSVELGMRFRSSIPGNITGFRYYKGAGTTGVHIGHLWDNNGTLLASETFTNETASGWQSVTLSSPVAILPNTTYVVSYFSTSGDFVRTVSFFTSAIQNGFLKGLADGEDGLNGVYSYSGSPTFPTNSSLSSNYYADVIFTSSDITPPQVISVNPANNATGIALNITPSATFDEALDPATVNSNTVTMKDPGNVLVPGTVSLAGAVITYTPTNPLAIGTTYTLTLKGGTNPPLIEDLSGIAMTSDYSWSFTTGGLTSPTVTLDPVSQSTCANSNISFTSNATGIPTPTPHWQVSTDNGTSWTDIPLATNATYTFSAASADNNNQYRAIWNNSQGADTSNPATLTVASTITGNLQAVNANICPGSPLELVLTSATGPSPYTLQVNNTTYTGVTVGQPVRALDADETLWPSSTIPSILAQPDNNSVEVGVKFQTNKNGFVKGIRFYKGSTANGGTHTGSLWTITGTLLATATFTNETNSGWQEVLFSTPVNVNANTTYVASYFAPQGNYSKNGTYFSVSYSNGKSLTALQNTVGEPNAVYVYTGTGAFPDQNFGDPNYWVDVVFAPYITSTTTFNLTNMTASNGCSVSGNPLSSTTITVSATVNAGTVSGLSPLCIGAPVTYTTNGDPGGTWSSSNELAATVNAVSGLVTGIGPGSSTITYTVNGCNGTAFNSQVVNITPNADPGTITGSSPLCIGATPLFTTNGESGGVWSSTSPSVASVNPATGLVTALAPGTTNIRYTLNVGCNSPIFASYSVTVNSNANAGTVSGTSPLCIGATATYTSDGDGGGTWSSTNPAVASVNPTSGLVTALTAGSTDITYTVSGCNGPSASFKTLTVNSCASIVNLTLYLEGYYLGGGQMDAVMLNQGVGADPTNTDNITVELHAATAPYALVASSTGMLKTNGTASITFPSLNGSYYIAVIHRNSIQTWSANPVTVGAVPADYNFTTAANKAYGDNMKQVGGVWVFFTGDINQDEFIDVNDFPDFDLDSFNGVSFQYKTTDLNGDGFVDANDFPVFDFNSFNGVSSIHP